MEAFSLFEQDKKKEIDIENFEKDFKTYLPELNEKNVIELCQFIKHPSSNVINIQEAVQKLTIRIKNHLK